MLKTLFIAICLSAALAAQEVDGKGNYLLNDSPVKGKVQMSLLNPGGLWKVKSLVLEARLSPDSKSDWARTFQQGEIIQANAGTGGSDEGLRNVKDAQGQYWMGCRDVEGNDLGCWVPATTETLTPVSNAADLSAAPSTPSAAASEPPKAMLDIPDAARTDEGGAASLRPYVVQFEAMMRWESNEPNWKARRSAWSLEVIQARQVSKLAALVAELEANTRCYDGNWSKGRQAWIKQVGAATTRKALSKLLQQFESSVNGDSMLDNWKEARQGWLENVANAGNS